MFVKSVAIRNFRSISPDGLVARFGKNLTVLVGKNNSGKTNILDAMEIVLGALNPYYRRLEPRDYFDRSSPIEITVTLGEISWGEAKTCGFSDPMCARITKKGRPGEIDLCYLCPAVEGPGEVPEEPDDEEKDEDGEAQARQTFELRIDDGKPVFQRREELRRALCDYLLVPAIREPGRQLATTERTAYGRMLRTVLADSGKVDDLRKVIDRANSELLQVFKTEKDRLRQLASVVAYVDDFDFTLTEEGNPEELLRNVDLSVTYQGQRTPLERMGTGTQSAVIIALLEIALAHRGKHHRLFALEEPELFLHPQAIRLLTSLISRLSKQSNAQVILTTHSPLIVANADIRHTIIVRRPAGATILAQVPDTPSYDLHKLQRELTAENAELFFADTVLLVEGPTERIVLPLLSKHLDKVDKAVGPCDFDKHNVSVIAVGSKANFLLYAQLLDDLGIPYWILADRDIMSEAIKPLAKHKKVALKGGETNFEDDRKALRAAGIVVLKQGEFEDYYSAEVIAKASGLPMDEVKRRLAERTVLDVRERLPDIISILLQRRLSDLQTKGVPADKVVKVWYDQALQEYREAQHEVMERRKTSEIVAGMFPGDSKPRAALRIVQAMIDLGQNPFPVLIRTITGQA